VPRTVCLLALVPAAVWAQSAGPPSYTAAGLVNAATNLPGPLAPNSWATIYGSNLAWTTVTAGAADITGDQLPTKIVSAGVQILLHGGTPAPLLFVSPTQINFLVPGSFTPGDTSLMVVRNGVAGPSIPFTVTDFAPGIFQNNSVAVAAHADGSIVNSDAPAAPGEIIVLYCTGLGQTVAPLDTQTDGRLVPLNADLAAIRIQDFADLAITINGVALDPQRILWAGLTPGFAGLYQINLKLPDTFDPNPEVRVWIGAANSPSGVTLAAHP
jgi:uncharacterized protein (TIGR03437 family)